MAASARRLGYGDGYGRYGCYGSPHYGSATATARRLRRLRFALLRRYGYGSPYYGWYGDYYYPGTGYYVYDSYRRPYAMTTTQRQYWSNALAGASHDVDRTGPRSSRTGAAFNQRQTASRPPARARSDARRTRRNAAATNR